MPESTTRGATTRQRALRTDARRNRERLLVAAEAAFAEEGTDASLDDVARRAGVGVGTVYRHFPSRQALLEGILELRLDALLARAQDLHQAEFAGDALSTWIRAFARHAASYRGLAGSMAATILNENSELAPLCRDVVEAGGRLLVRAQRSGEVRADVEVADLVTIINAVAATAERAKEHPQRVERFLALVLDGLRPP